MSIQTNKAPLTLIHPQYKPLIFQGAAVTSLAALALLTPWESIRIIGMTILAGVSGNIVNHWFSCHNCEYYAKEKKSENQLIRSESPILNALAWGVIYVGKNKTIWIVCAQAGCFLPSSQDVQFN